MRPALRAMQDAFDAQRGALFPWAPVCLGLGVGLYFALRAEPPAWVLWTCGGAGGMLLLLYLRTRFILIAALGLIACGVALAGARAHAVAGPKLDFRYYGAVQGRIVGIDRSASDAVRLTLDRVVLERMAPADTPTRVRISLHGQQGYITPQPGAVVILTGHLAPPSGAVEPGGFDFRRHAWFLRLGAVGYTRNPVLLLEPPGQGQAVFKARMWLSARVQAALPGETGAFAAALTAGDRSAMGQDMVEALRATNLAHLLAISGLHMGLLAGFVFAALRLGLLLIPRARHYWPVKRVAAMGALVAAAGYLALSGGNVATERAFIMVSVALVALLFDRRALSLRSVAIAALIILCLQPETLLSPGFQMSFAATTAMVAAFERSAYYQRRYRWPRWTGPVISVLVSSAVAGAATAPVGIAHFNYSASYGLLANLIAVWVMGVWVMPLAVLAAVLMPFGVDWIALTLMGFGLDWVLFVATTIAGWEGAVRPVPAPGPAVLPLMAAGGLLLCLWQGWGRMAGLGPLAAALWLWVQSDRPPVLIADSGALVGVLTEQGRALSRPRGSGFVAGVWLENDGTLRSQEDAAALWPAPDSPRVARITYGSLDLVHLQGKRAVAGFTACVPGQIVVASVSLPGAPDCLHFDPDRLRDTGAIALWPATPDRPLRIRTAAEHTGTRLWTQ